MSAPATVPSLFLDRVERGRDRVAFRRLAAGGAPADEVVTWGEWDAAAHAFAAELIAAGHEPGDTVGIWAGNRPAWPIAEVGTLLAGGVSTGLYPGAAPAQVRHVLGDASVRTIVVDTPDRLDTVYALRRTLPGLERIIAAHAAAGAADEGEEAAPAVVRWGDWLERGRRALSGPDRAAALRQRAKAARPDDTAVLIYTSGSTGEPRGAEVAHRYLLASARSIRETLELTDSDRTLSFLPYGHAAERVFGLHTRIFTGMETGLVEDPALVPAAARAFGPTLFGGLPRFYEKASEALRAERNAAAGPERERWDRTLRLGQKRSRLRRAGHPVPTGLDDQWRESGEPLFRRVAERFGGRVRRATSGGASLPIPTAEFLDALGFTILGAYGLTEHLCVAFNRSDRYAFDAAGPPMPGTELRIADDGEILVRRGDLTFSGYRGRPEATRTAFSDDGEWLRTGDLGTIDARGFLRVTGRKKDLIALSTGKKVAPAPTEARLAEHPWITHAVLHGEGRKFVSALLCLSRPAVESWARANGIEADPEALMAHPDVRAGVQGLVDGVNAGLSRAERIRRFVVLDRELRVEEGELTPTLKVRRPAVEEMFRDRLDALYR